MNKAKAKPKARKKLKDLPARPMSEKAAGQVKAGQTFGTNRPDPYKNFKF